MMRVLITFGFFFALVLADPVPKLSSPIDDLETSIYEVEGNQIKRVARLAPDTVSFVFDILSTIIGKKFDALSLAVSAIQWLVSNCSVVALGVISTIGFCKFTGTCSLSYDDILPVSQLTSYITPEHIQTAERFLVTAVEKYADERRRSYSPLID